MQKYAILRRNPQVHLTIITTTEPDNQLFNRKKQFPVSNSLYGGCKINKKPESFSKKNQ
jgi:hypothetical protein